MTDIVAFRVTAERPKQVVPVVNGRSLVDLVSAFEAAQGWEPAGGYSGLVPDHFRFGELTQYYLGRETRQWPERGRAWLLGCDCGEVGCWPLDASIEVTGDRVVWQDFRQPHRPKRAYQGFGPFVFAREVYERSVRVAVAALGLGSPRARLRP